MTSSKTLTQSAPAVASTAPTPGKLRRTALVVAGFLSCALPTLWAVNFTRMLVTGADSDHRFHQLTGQGLLLCALWLVPLVAMLRAGWRGERPATAWGWAHLTFVVTGAVCAGFATGGGAPSLMVLIGVTGSLLWAALPRRPRLGGSVRIHPALAPAALLTSAFYVPYALGQLDLQNGVTAGMHLDNPHFFDMAWLVSALVVLAVLGALTTEGRRLAAGAGLVSMMVGLAGLATGESTTWSIGAAVLGVALLLSAVGALRAGEDR